MLKVIIRGQLLSLKKMIDFEDESTPVKVFHVCGNLETLRIFSRLIGIIDLEKEFEERLCILVQYIRKRKYREALSRNLILGAVYCPVSQLTPLQRVPLQLVTQKEDAWVSAPSPPSSSAL